MEMRLSDVAKVLMGTLKGDCDFQRFVIDSRQVCAGDVFVCLKGARVDGHDFIRQAEENGAVGFLCERPLQTSLPYVIVNSCLEGLQQFSAWYRDGLNVKLVAVTGSVGKTTTKECIASVLSQKYKTHKTDGNKNSETGLPLTLLGIQADDEAAVVEMGMSARGEIRVLSDIARPDIAVITNIGMSHIENLGSQENILQAKLEILSGLKPDGLLIINGDDEYLNRAYQEQLLGKIPQKIIRYGINSSDCDVTAQDIVMESDSLRFLIQTPQGEATVIMPCEGVHNVYNALAAVCVGISMNVPLEDICQGLNLFKNVPLRQQTYDKNGFHIIEDCYNASPASMQAAVDMLNRRPGRKIAILGDMLELGDFARDLHVQVGRMLKNVDLLIAFGEFGECYIEGAVSVGIKASNCYHCKDVDEVAQTLTQLANVDDHILIKASRGMQAENVMKKFFELKNGGAD